MVNSACQLTHKVRASADLIDHSRLEIHKHRARHVLTSAGLGEEGVEGVVAAADRLVRRHLTVRLNAVLQAEELPAGVTDLRTRLAHVDEDGLTHGWLSLRFRSSRREV